MNVKTTTNKIDIACNTFKQVHNSGVSKFHTLDSWLEKESNTFLSETVTQKHTYKKFVRGQVVKVDFGINIGSELCYTHFAIVITKKDSINSDIVTIVPITSKKGSNRVSLGKLLHKAYPNSLKYNLYCYANLTQIRSISKNRIFSKQKQFVCDPSILNKIDTTLVTMYTNQNIPNKTVKSK